MAHPLLCARNPDTGTALASRESNVSVTARPECVNDLTAVGWVTQVNTTPNGARTPLSSLWAFSCEVLGSSALPFHLGPADRDSVRVS